jgi:hypothetical protein
VAKQSTFSGRFRPALEIMEARLVPAVQVTVLDLDNDGVANDLKIVGDDKANRIRLLDDPSGTLQLEIDANGDGDTSDPADRPLGPVAGFEKVILIVLGNGNDRVTHTVLGDFAGAERRLIVNLGQGNDFFHFTTNEHDVLAGSDVAITLFAGGGTDQAEVLFDGVSSSAVSVQALMGAGADGKLNTPCLLTFGQEGGSIDNFASVDADWDLGAGVNNLQVAVGAVGADADGQATVDIGVLGGTAADKIGLDLLGSVGNGTAPSNLTFAANLLAGNDIFTGRVNADQFNIGSGSQVRLTVLGNDGDDTLGLATFGDQASVIDLDAESLFAAVFRGGLGNDVFNFKVFASVQAPGSLKLDGQLYLRLDGGEGNDQITLKLLNTAASVGNYNAAVFGGFGKDTVKFGLSHNAAAVTFKPRGKVLLDGGLGLDKLENTTPGVSIARFFET